MGVGDLGAEENAERARRAGDQRQAAELFAAAADSARDASERARLLIRRAHCLINLGRYLPAEQEALDLFTEREHLDPVVTADVLGVVALARRHQGALTASMEALADALTYIDQGTRRHPDYARVLHNVAVAHSRAGMWPRAISLFERSLHLPDGGGRPLTMAAMASAYVDQVIASPTRVGEPHDGIAEAARLAGRVTVTPDRDRIAYRLALANSAVCRLWSGDHVAAEAQARDASAGLDEQQADLEMVRSHFVLGETALAAHHRSGALDRFRRCLAVAMSTGIESFPPRVFRRIAALHVDHNDLASLHGVATEVADWFESRIAAERADRIAHVELGVRHRAVEALSLEDPLTKLPNRRFLDAWLPRALESGQIAAVAVVDLDDFKQINDGASYETGDQVLTEFAEVLRAGVRRGDVAARIGGDEFVLALSADAAEAAAAALDRLRSTVEGHRWASWPEARLTVSIGLTMADGRDASTCVRIAGAAARTAKMAGRNRVILAPT